jgi:hypothetical protein
MYSKIQLGEEGNRLYNQISSILTQSATIAFPNSKKAIVALPKYLGRQIRVIGVAFWPRRIELAGIWGIQWGIFSKADG